MSETETVDSTESTEKTEVEKSSKPAGYDPVDPTTASPEQMQERLNYLYSQVKDNKRTLTEYRKIAADQSKHINDLTNGMGNVVNHLQEKNLSDTESQLITQRNAAYEAGDNKAYHEAQDKLDDIRLQKKLAAQQKTTKAAPVQQPVERGYDDPEEEAYVDSWQREKSETGELMRPWSFESHSRHKEALLETEAVFKNPRFKDMTTQEKLAEVDKRMGISKTTSKQTVMGGGFTGTRKSSTLKLSPQQEKLATRTKFGGPKANDAEHIEAYRKQLEKSQQRRGTK